MRRHRACAELAHTDARSPPSLGLDFFALTSPSLGLAVCSGSQTGDLVIGQTTFLVTPPDHRVDGNRVYRLSAFRGLMVFDITQVDGRR
jgi:hypothetical protein